MKYETCSPRRIIPYHVCHPGRLKPHPSYRRFGAGRTTVQGTFPAIPVLEIPPGLHLPGGTPLTKLGDYILYNGHHRRLSAICAGMPEVSIAVLENDADLLVNGGTELLRTNPRSICIAAHKKNVYDAVISGTETVLWAESSTYERAPIPIDEVYSPMWNLVSTRATQFRYFDRVLNGPEWRNKKILDFGGNIGSLLDGSGKILDKDDYWCVDINKTVIAIGRREHPEAHFVHYDRQSSQYNPDGACFLPIPDCGEKFDMILAFSVFTHTHSNEMLEMVPQLRAMLAPSGVLAFTFSDPGDPRSRVRDMIERQGTRNPKQVNELMERARQSNWCLLIDDTLYVEPGDEFSQQVRQGKRLESYCSYFSAEFVSSLFPDSTVCSPVGGEWQHCCIIRN